MKKELILITGFNHKKLTEYIYKNYIHYKSIIYPELFDMIPIHPSLIGFRVESSIDLEDNNIILTQSEHVLNSIRIIMRKLIKHFDVKILFLNEKYKIIPIGIDENGEIDNWENGFFDQEEKDLATLFKIQKKYAKQNNKISN